MTYKISRRIEAEERALENAMVVFTSTQEEVEKQWGLYDACAPVSLSALALLIAASSSCLPCLPQMLSGMAIGNGFTA